MVGKVTYSYIPQEWDQRRFFELGGFVVVFLNYNKASMICKSVSSALEQDYPLLEMFFMDDASTDGSGDTMEMLVRSYHGRHKVTVVRNTENQHICGQWNIVSKLATGKWYGMFCADDVAYLNRVSKAASIILSHQDLLGMSTNVRSENVLSRQVIDPLYRPVETIGMGYSESISDAIMRTPVVGATAFWRRDLFEQRLPKAPLDDVLLRTIVHAKSSGTAVQTWLWAGDVNTVTYSVGAGITSEGGEVGKDIEGDYVASWVARRPFVVRMQRCWMESMKAAEEWLRESGGDVHLIRQVHEKCLDLKYQSDHVESSFEWLSVLFFSRMPWRGKAHLFFAVFMYHIRKCCGLKFAAKVEQMIHPRLAGCGG